VIALEVEERKLDVVGEYSIGSRRGDGGAMAQYVRSIHLGHLLHGY
jgi:hypothetical protein